MDEHPPPNVLLVTFPAQGHINPGLQFAKTLIRYGLRVTFATTVFAYRRMRKTPTPTGLSFATFSDGYDDGGPSNIDRYITELEHRSRQNLTDLIVSETDNGRRFTFIVYSALLPWVAGVARSVHLPSVFLWNQPATVLGIYYYYFHGYGATIKKNSNDPSLTMDLPGLPLLSTTDLPSFLDPSNLYGFALPLMEKHFEILSEEKDPRILVNTFDELEHKALRAIDKVNLIPVGPLIPSAFSDGKDPSDTSFGADLFHGISDCRTWLSTKPKSSVVYVSFGSFTVLSKQQSEEIARGLLDSGRPFLWVLRKQQNKTEGEEIEEEEEEEGLTCREELERRGKIVEWCSQVEVLSNPSVGCFVSHCGWNSTVEGLVAGKPMVGFPQWSDQRTNAKLIEEVWKIGVRLRRNEVEIVEAEEIKRCLDLVMGEGEEGEEMRRNAERWKELGRAAVKEGGSSDLNLKALVDEIRRT